MPDELFPAEAPGALGYPHAVFRGMKGYNGVAILSRLPIERARHRARLVRQGRLPAHRGRRWTPRPGRSSCTISTCRPAATSRTATQNPKYGHKLDFIAEARNWFAARTGLARTVLVGDLNIAPLEHDVWSHKQLLDVVSHTPPETEGLNAWLNTGFVDAVRHFVPADQKLYTWWSYRNRDWRASDRGRRLDHVWVTPDLQGALARHDDPEGRPRLAAGVGPRAGVRRAGGVAGVSTRRGETRVTGLRCRIPGAAFKSPWLWRCQKWNSRPDAEIGPAAARS